MEILYFFLFDLLDDINGGVGANELLFKNARFEKAMGTMLKGKRKALIKILQLLLGSIKASAFTCQRV